MLFLVVHFHACKQHLTLQLPFPAPISCSTGISLHCPEAPAKLENPSATSGGVGKKWQMWGKQDTR